ncbi:MAG: hypothetical protein AB1744_04775 [Candidatus Zixiibacteriota bacterium]
MNSKIALIFYYKRENRYSYNALAGAMEKDLEIRKINVYFLANEKEILHEIPIILENHEKIIGSYPKSVHEN